MPDLFDLFNSTIILEDDEADKRRPKSGYQNIWNHRIWRRNTPQIERSKDGPLISWICIHRYFPGCVIYNFSSSNIIVPQINQEDEKGSIVETELSESTMKNAAEQKRPAD